VDGNDVRRLVFRQLGGYDTAAVDELLDRVADELDAGRPVANLIEGATFPPQPLRLSKGFRGGYDYASVDWVLSQLCRQDDPEARADPWRNLPAWNYRIASPDAGAAQPTRVARGAAALPRNARAKAEKDFRKACAEACRDFATQPGAQLSLVKTGIARWELRSPDRYVLVSARTTPTRTFDRDGRTYRLSRVRRAQWQAVAAEIGEEPTWSPAHLPRTEPAARTEAGAAGAASGDGAVKRQSMSLKSLADAMGQTVLYTGGAHSDQYPGGYVRFPGRRWLRFPVRGTTRSNAIMTAVDQAGRQLARYMIADRRAIDIVVHPDQRLTDELILTVALSARWVSSFFTSSGGGG
jgi:DivIVA domain-containing protein